MVVLSRKEFDNRDPAANILSYIAEMKKAHPDLVPVLVPRAGGKTLVLVDTQENSTNACGESIVYLF